MGRTVGKDWPNNGCNVNKGGNCDELCASRCREYLLEAQGYLLEVQEIRFKECLLGRSHGYPGRHDVGLRPRP